jgi:2-polyprenyl-3-methyl-5-hydroxy-6-metoxy-1,4-benzoquinol methylase
VSEAQTEDYGWDAIVPESSNYINPAIRRLVKAAAPRDILDVGCGNGVLCGDLADDGFAVVGVDADARAIEIAREKYPKPRFELISLDDAPSAIATTNDGLFDAVVSTEVIEHIYSPHKWATFCFDALRPGGTLIVTTPYHGYLKNLALSLVDKWDGHHDPLWYGGHIKFWSKTTLSKLLTNAGFDVVGFEGVGRMPYLWKSMILIARKPGGK